MKAHLLKLPSDIQDAPLQLSDLPEPVPGDEEILIRVHACGVCHTDLHIVEGDLRLPVLPIVPGHQIVGTVTATGAGVTRFQSGDRIGVPWLYCTCGECTFCRSGRENLCDHARFTGYHVNGGFAESVLVREGFAYRIPEGFPDVQAAPLLCAGVIGYRALRLSGIQPGQRLGLYGFGASAHIAIQVARHRGCEIFVFTRGRHHHELAESLGATWTGTARDAPPFPLDGAVIFAPAGELVPASLRALRKGGTVALAGIHMSPIPEMEYGLLYEERTLRSVANSTRDDVHELLAVASQIPVRTEVEIFPFEDANRALQKLKMSEIKGSGVLRVWG